MEDFTTRYSMKDIRMFAEKAEQLKVLVVGDIIIDKYTYCDVQGLMSKDMGYSARIQSSEEHLGGSVAIARHLSSFTGQLTPGLCFHGDAGNGACGGGGNTRNLRRRSGYQMAKVRVPRSAYPPQPGSPARSRFPRAASPAGWWN